MDYETQLTKFRAYKQQNHGFYLLKNPEDALTAVKNLGNLEREIVQSDIPTKFKENALEEISSLKNYLKGFVPKKENNLGYLLPIAILSFLAGVIAKDKFDDFLEKSDERIANLTLTELSNHLRAYNNNLKIDL